jgi:type II restriction enzyme
LITSLQCEIAKGAAYKSPTQIARVVTENWAASNLYCVACDSDKLQQTPANTKALDFQCLKCSETYQLKSQKQLNLRKVTDGAYSAMVAALRQNAAPNLLILNYSSEWTVRNLVLFPSIVFTESTLEKRNPLGEHARRAGWMGCNIVLARIPADAQIPVVRDATIIPASAVREKYKTYQTFEKVQWDLRGWTLDMLGVLRQLGKDEFTLHHVYARESDLARMYPGNRNVKAKIRQQLQVLRDLGFLEFLGGAKYPLKSPGL